MINDMDIIHMNGRTYDPTLGRFLQADPFVQAPSNSQSYNRYAYVLNNPLSYTDPSGYFFKKLGKFIKKHWRVIAAAVVTYFTAGAASGWATSWAAGAFGAGTTAAAVAGGALTGAIAGAAGGLVATGSLKGALIGAFSGAVFGGIGGGFNADSGFFAKGGAGHIGSHAVAGGVMSDLQGGKFGHGFWSAGLTKGLNVNGMIDTAGAAYDAARIAVAAVIGGTISKVTGGKFGNGAVTAGFAQMLNGNSQIKGGRNNPMGIQTNGSMKVKMGDGNYHWVDAETYMNNTVNEKLATASGTTLDKYVITTDKDKAYALGLVATGLSLGGAVIPSTIAGFGAFLYDPSDANAFSMIAGPLAHGASYVYRPFSEVISNLGNITGAVSVTVPIAQNYVEKR